MDFFIEELPKRNIVANVKQTGCMGYCYAEPTLEITIQDDITSAVSRLVSAQLQRQHNFFAQTSATSASQFKFRTKIETLDGGNVGVLEAWYLEGCYLQNVTYDTFDYSSSEPMQITLSLRYDNATQDTVLTSAVTEALVGA